MLTRRQFGAAMASAGMLSTAPAGSDGLPVIRLGNAAGIIDPQLIYMTMGQHPRLNFYKDEGVVLDIVNMSGSGQTLQAIASHSSETSSLAPIVFFGVYAKTPSIDIVYPYVWLRQVHWAVGVKPDSPIRTLQDLKGKTIGIRNQGDTGYIAARYMLQELGISPDGDVNWISVGEGGPAGDAVYKGRVDAMAFWDGAFARIGLAGFPLRMLDNSPRAQRLFGQANCVRKSDFEKNRDLYARFFRANAKSTVFACANVDLAIRLHWEIYPESKPKGFDDAKALADARVIVESRKDKWLPAAWQADKRFGASTPEEWDASVAFAGLQKQLPDIRSVYTYDLIEEINRFDQAAIAAQARAMTI
jgi:NitT/TauT family transport system substrate-binding protein